MELNGKLCLYFWEAIVEEYDHKVYPITFGIPFEELFPCSKKINYFRGGLNDLRMTEHEVIFKYMFNESFKLKEQVSFGTGKNGLKIWHAKKYVADFVDESIKAVFEIDGKNHESKYRKLKDELKEIFFMNKGYSLIRIKNEQVEKWFSERILEWKNKGIIRTSVLEAAEKNYQSRISVSDKLVKKYKYLDKAVI